MKQVRQQDIVDLIKKEGYVSTDELAAHFGVSAQTIRRDLDDLDDQGILNKMYGGATLVGGMRGEKNYTFFNHMPPTDRKIEKEIIAARALSFVEDGQTIALDIGSTTRAMGLELIKKNNLVIITKDMILASALYDHPTNRVYLVGGFLDANGTTSGEFIREFLESVSRIDCFFLSADGVTVNEGFTNNYAGVEAYRSLFIPLAMKRIALADHTKFGQIGFYRTCGLTDVDNIVTDSAVDKAMVDDIRNAGANITIAD